MMELLAPAGDLEKMAVAYRYGADAVYFGIGSFSLRKPMRAAVRDEQHPSLASRLTQLKMAAGEEKKLYGALNIYFRPSQFVELERAIAEIAELPLDAVIVSDIGVIDLLKKHLPGVELHLSTQANCTNAAAARRYWEMGFSRVIAARELSLEEIATIKAQLPGLELEVFVHGAICLAYSGRCLLSGWLAGRSGNAGECAHSCRWNYRLAVEEEKRPGEYLPVVEGDGYSQILSPKDLCLIDHLGEISEAGVDCVKIEGRMKSAYYAAIVTRAYRAELDRVAVGAPLENTAAMRGELANVSHRPYSTGFLFGDPRALDHAEVAYRRSHIFLASVEEEMRGGQQARRFRLAVKNGFSVDTQIEFVGPRVAAIEDGAFSLFDAAGNKVEEITHQSGGSIQPSVEVESGYLIRTRILGGVTNRGAPDEPDRGDRFGE